MTALAEGAFWSLPRIAGAIIVGSAGLLGVASLVASVRGDVRAVEATFRDIDVAIGNTSTLRVMTVSWGVWSIVVLAGFVVLAVEYWSHDVRLVPALAVTGLTVFSLAWVIEASFHSSVTVWAVSQLEQGAEVPALFGELKNWLNFWLQALVNPLALLSFVGLGLVGMQLDMLPSWAGWIIVGWSGVFVFFPLPLAIAPIALFFGAVLLVVG